MSSILLIVVFHFKSSWFDCFHLLCLMFCISIKNIPVMNAKKYSQKLQFPSRCFFMSSLPLNSHFLWFRFHNSDKKILHLSWHRKYYVTAFPFHMLLHLFTSYNFSFLMVSVSMILIKNSVNILPDLHNSRMSFLIISSFLFTPIHSH